MTGKPVKAHWLHSKGPEAVFALRMSCDKEPVCIDKDLTARTVLHNTLTQLQLEHTHDLEIYSWKMLAAKQLHYFFIDSDQNSLVKQEFTTIDSS